MKIMQICFSLLFFYIGFITPSSGMTASENCPVHTLIDISLLIQKPSRKVFSRNSSLI